MPPALFDIVSPSPRFDELPLEIRQKSSPFSILIALALLVPALAVILVPLGLVAAYAVAQPAPMSLLIEKPLASLQILTGMAMYLLVLARPMRGLLNRIGRDRIIRFSDGRVAVSDRHLFRRSSWSLPVSAFRGIAHNVRTTLSTTCEDLILVHPERRFSLLLCTGKVISCDLIQNACHALAMPQLPARELYFKLGNFHDLRLAAMALRHRRIDQRT